MKDLKQIEFEIDQANNIKELERIENRLQESNLERERLMEHIKNSESTVKRLKKLNKKMKKNRY